MKILVLQDHLRSGGTERQSVLLSGAFAAEGHVAALTTFRPGGALDATVAPQVRRRTLQPFDLHLDWFAPGLRDHVAEFAPDVLLCMGRMANCYAGPLQEKFPQVAVICTMRTGKALPARFVRSLRVCRHVVANSREARDNLVATHRIDAEKISVIYNSLVFPPESAVWRNHVLRQNLGANTHTKVLLCVAMFRPEKNQRELVEIVAGLPAQLDWQLWLAGEGPSRAACEELVTAKGLGGRVKFLGFQSNPTPLYCAADLAVHASGSEALSNFLIEAQAHGLLGVAYDAQGISECFQVGRTGWVIPRDDRGAFRDTLSRRMTEPDIAHAERSADARNYARTTFDRKRQVDAYLELFTRLL
jgi:glycosyltransferase involved in cell wall biosynthesis